MKRWAVLALVVVASLLPRSLPADAASSTISASLSASTHQLAASGGVIKLTAAVEGAETCQFFSAPEMASLSKTVSCSNGTLVRTLRVGRVSGNRTMRFLVVASDSSGVYSSRPVTVNQGSVSVPVVGLRSVFHQASSGEATTNSFAIPASAGLWFVDWSYSCPAGLNIFSYDVYEGNIPDLNDIGPEDLNASGSGTDSFTDGGVFHLQVVSECSWVIDVNYFPPTPTPASAPTVTATVKTSVSNISQSGGPVTVTANVKHAKWCTFITSPPIAGLDGRQHCGTGAVARQGQVTASGSPQSLEIEVVATGVNTIAAASGSIVERNPQTLISLNGSSNTTSPQFTIPPSDTQWAMNWSFSCGTYSFAPTTPIIGFMDVLVMGSTTDSFVSPVSNGSSGTQTFTDTGSFSLDISSTCNWTVSVVG